MTVDTKEVVTTIAYMIGVRMSALTVSYGMFRAYREAPSRQRRYYHKIIGLFEQY